MRNAYIFDKKTSTKPIILKLGTSLKVFPITLERQYQITQVGKACANKIIPDQPAPKKEQAEQELLVCFLHQIIAQLLTRIDWSRSSMIPF